MKTKHARFLIALALLALSTLHSPLSTAHAQGTAFTYQGRLNDGAGPANGSYDLAFSLFNAGTGGSQVGNTLTYSAVGVSNGLFTAALDFGAGVFTGANLWLDISVRTNGGGAFSELVPRQPLTPAPYAIMAGSASNILGALPASQLSGTIGLAQLPGVVITNNETGVTLGNVTINGDVRIDNNRLLLSTGTDTSDGLAYASSGLPFVPGGAGPFLFGWNGGALGTANPTEVSLAWDWQGNAWVSNKLWISAGLNIDQKNGNAGNVNSNALTFGLNSGEGIASKRNGASGSWDLEFYTDFNNRMTILQGGNVGINTTTPTETLEINGTSRIDDNDMYLRAGTDHNHGLGYRASVSAISTDGPFLYGFNGGALGTTAPDAIALKWDWNGNAWVSNNMSITAGLNVDQKNGNVGNVNANALTFGLNSGEGIASKRSGANPYDLEFWTDFNNRMTILQNGKVGINMTAPTEALDVNGEFIAVEGLGGVRCYMGDDGFGNDVQVGSLKSGVTAVAFYNTADNAYMHLYCSSITIEGGADLAEPFPISTAGLKVSEGAVMVIDEENPGHLKLADRPYDTRVAGVVSGANGVNPGIQMQQQGLVEGGRNVALTGRVYVQADTSGGPIKPGDLLTTSSTPGRAMKVSDHVRAQGAILGKAMTGLSAGEGMVLALVTLQ